MSEDRTFLKIRIWQWDGVAGLAALVGVITLCIAGGFTIYELKVHAAASRAKETLHLVEVWETGGFRKSYQSLQGRVALELSKLPEGVKREVSERPRKDSAVYREISNSILSSEGGRAEFEDLFYFFQRVDVCAQANLCSKEANEIFFRWAQDMNNC